MTTASRKNGARRAWQQAAWSLLVGGLIPVLCAAEQPTPKLPPGGARVIVAGDRIHVTVEEAPDLNKDYTVAADGSIDFSYHGRVIVGDLTCAEAADELERVLQETHFKRAHVFVEISAYLQGSIFIQGAVGNPGSIETTSDSVVTLLEAIAKARGLTDQADPSKVKIIRWKYGGGLQREVFTVDIRDMIDGKDYSQDQFLRPRDIVIVPSVGGSEGGGEFLALGEVGNAGFHPVTKGLDVIRAITSLGGLSDQAKMEAARILRPEASGQYRVISLDLLRLFGMADMSMNILIEPGDILFVPNKETQASGRVYFLGEVARPGMYPLPMDKEATLARTILNSVGGLTKFANERKIKVIRVAPDGTKETLYFDVGDILKTGAFDKDLPLRDEDVIIVEDRGFIL